MKPSSAKQKGRLLQQYVRDAIYKSYPQLEDGDVRSTSMGAGGCDILLSPRAKDVFGPFSIECKSRASFVGYSYLDQASSNRERESDVAIAVIKKNGRKPVVVVDFDFFMQMMYKANIGGY